jgi:hypothetical protein
MIKKNIENLLTTMQHNFTHPPLYNPLIIIKKDDFMQIDITM